MTTTTELAPELAAREAATTELREAWAAVDQLEKEQRARIDAASGDPDEIWGPVESEDAAIEKAREEAYAKEAALDGAEQAYRRAAMLQDPALGRLKLDDQVLLKDGRRGLVDELPDPDSRSVVLRIGAMPTSPREKVAISSIKYAGSEWQQVIVEEAEVHLLAHQRKLRLRADDLARKEILEEQGLHIEPPAIRTLRESLAQPPAPPMRIEGLMPWDGGTLLVAQRKAGKTTLCLNLARSLLTGEDFLGRFGVIPLEGTVGYLNYEVGEQQFSHWAQMVGVDQDRLIGVHLRGQNPLATESRRLDLAKELREREVETLIVDVLAKAFVGESENDSAQMNRFLALLDSFARSEVGAKDVILVAHAGHEGAHARGSSALEGWGDSIITLLNRSDDDINKEVYLRAIGRDVEQEERLLTFDREAKTLRLTERTWTESKKDRTKARAQDRAAAYALLIPKVLSMADEKGPSKRGLQALVENFLKDKKDAIEDGEFGGSVRGIGGFAYARFNEGLELAKEAGEVEVRKEGQAARHYRKGMAPGPEGP